MTADGARPEPPLTHAAVLALAVPAVLANITTPLIGLADTAVLGRLGDAHLIGAAALGATIFNMLYWAFGFLRVGTTGLAAQADGAGAAPETAAVLLRALVIAGGAGAALILLQQPIAAAAFALLEGSSAVESEARTYFAIRVWGAPMALANFALLGWFIGLGRARTALLLQLVINGLNLALDVWFVLGLGWSVAGVAAGTVIAETTGAALGLAIAAAIIRERSSAGALASVFDPSRLRRALAVNGDIMIRTLALLFAFVWFMAQSAAAGDVTLAANAVLMQFVTFSAYLLDGFALSAETLTGRAIGAGRRASFREAVWLSSLWAGALGVGLSLVFWVAGAFIIDLLALNAEVRSEARAFLVWAALMPVIGVACWQLDGVFAGATRSADMRNMALLSSAVFLAAWAILTPPFGNHGLWLSLLILNVARGATLAARFPALERNAFGATLSR